MSRHTKKAKHRGWIKDVQTKIVNGELKASKSYEPPPAEISVPESDEPPVASGTEDVEAQKAEVEGKPAKDDDGNEIAGPQKPVEDWSKRPAFVRRQMAVKEHDAGLAEIEKKYQGRFAPTIRFCESPYSDRVKVFFPFHRQAIEGEKITDRILKEKAAGDEYRELVKSLSVRFIARVRYIITDQLSEEGAKLPELKSSYGPMVFIEV